MYRNVLLLKKTYSVISHEIFESQRHLEDFSGGATPITYVVIENTINKKLPRKGHHYLNKHAIHTFKAFF